MARRCAQAPSGSLPLPCQQLAVAQAQLLALQSGTAVASIETPELGRVEFTKGTIPDLQRLVDRLTGECAAATGQANGSGSGRRRPISIEAWP